MKVCSQCLLEKEDCCFRISFDKRRNRWWTRCECIPCQYLNRKEWYKKYKGSEKFAEMSLKWWRTYSKKIKNTPIETKRRQGANERNRVRIGNLDTLYINEKIRRVTGLRTKEIPAELVEIKTKQLISCRTLKELRNSSRNQ